MTTPPSRSYHFKNACCEFRALFHPIHGLNITVQRVVREEKINFQGEVSFESKMKVQTITKIEFARHRNQGPIEGYGSLENRFKAIEQSPIFVHFNEERILVFFGKESDFTGKHSKDGRQGADPEDICIDLTYSRFN